MEVKYPIGLSNGSTKYFSGAISSKESNFNPKVVLKESEAKVDNGEPNKQSDNSCRA
jgi:hypothetical protein